MLRKLITSIPESNSIILVSSSNNFIEVSNTLHKSYSRHLYNLIISQLLCSEVTQVILECYEFIIGLRTPELFLGDNICRPISAVGVFDLMTSRTRLDV